MNIPYGPPANDFDHLLAFLPFEIRQDVRIEVAEGEQTKVIKPRRRLPWQDTTRFAIDLPRWQRLSRDQQKMYFLREAILTTELAMGNNWSALLIYPALLGAGTTGFLVELQLGDNLGTGLAVGLAGLAFGLLRRSERGQKAQVAADEYAIRHAAKEGNYSELQAASLLLSAWQQVMVLEEKSEPTYDITMRQRNLEYLSNRGLSSASASLSIVPPSR